MTVDFKFPVFSEGIVSLTVPLNICGNIQRYKVLP